MKKSKSSVPRFPERFELGPAPPVRKEGLFAMAGRPEPEPPLPPVGPLVAIAVGNTKEGESLPAKPDTWVLAWIGSNAELCLSYQASSSPYRYMPASVLNRNVGAVGSWELTCP
jgi:hypothetical protein